MKNEVKASWHQIDVQLKRRHDLIPNLISAVKGYMEFERDILEKVTRARMVAISAFRISDRARAESNLTRELKSLFATMEDYPSLKSSENVTHLQEELITTENRIAFARQFYNDIVAEFRTSLESFPDNIVSSLFSFEVPEFFLMEPLEYKTPRFDKKR